jgi:uncharacterized protein with GYD domain
MPTYVVLIKLTPAGRASIHNNPNRLAEVTRSVSA